MNYIEVFGSPAQCSILRRGEDVWRLIRGHARYADYGTVVALSDPGQDTSEIMARLARLQG